MSAVTALFAASHSKKKESADVPTVDPNDQISDEQKKAEEEKKKKKTQAAMSQSMTASSGTNNTAREFLTTF